MSMLDLLRGPLAAAPDAPLLIDAGAGEPIVVSRAAFWRRVASLRAELTAHGVQPGDCVATWLPNWSDALVWQFAAVAAGAHVIGINTRYNIEEARHVLQRARPAVVAVAHGFLGLDLRARLHAAAEGGAPSVAVIAGPRQPPATAEICAGYDLGAGAWVPSRDDPPAATLTDDPARLAAAFTTSGSTGKPKLAGHTGSAIASHARACAAAGGWTERSVFVAALPLSGVFAHAPAMATLAAGGVCVLEPAFDAAVIAADVGRHGVTHLIGGDDIVGRLFEAAQPGALASLERLFIADFNGRSVPLAAEAEARGVITAGVYGSSELFALTAFWRPEDAAPDRWSGGGRPVSPAIAVRAGDPETGIGLPWGTAGELQFRGYNVVDAYLGDAGLRDRVLTADGWFRSGDLGTVGRDGSFEYLCRAGDALRLRGFLVEPAEIENRLLAHQAVAEAKVVGLRPPEGETQAIAFVVLTEAATPATLLAWCAATLARHKVPHALHVIDAMPVTTGANGTKVRAAVLREWAAAAVSP